MAKKKKKETKNYRNLPKKYALRASALCVDKFMGIAGLLVTYPINPNP